MTTGRSLKIGYLMEKGEDIRRPPYNGPANHVRHVVTELARLGHSVKVLTWLDDGLWLTSDLTEFRRVTVRRSDHGPLRQIERGVRRTQATFGLPYFGYFDNLRFARACEQELGDCDVFIERMSWIMAGGAWAAKRLGIPLALEYNGDPLADLEAKGIAPQGLQRRISVSQMRRVLHTAGRVIATGDGWADNCAQVWGVPKDRIVTVENGTDLVHSLRREDLKSFRGEIDSSTFSPALQLEPPTLVYLGGFYAWHGLPVLLEAFPQVLARRPETRLVLIGSGPGEAEIRQKVKSFGLAGCVEFLGQLPVEQYAPVLAGADIGLSPYCGWPEYSGLKIFDYKAAGLPVIASGEAGRPRSVRPGETGLTVPPCEPDALAAAICRLLDDPMLRKRMGRQARSDAENLHGWEHTASALERVFLDLVTQHSPKR